MSKAGLPARLFALALLPAAACAGRQPAPRPLPARPEALQERRQPLEPFRAALRGKVRAPGMRGRFVAGVGALPPDYRIDVFHPVSGETLLSLGVKGDRMRAVWPGQGECMEAAASADVMAAILGIEVSAAGLLPILSAHVYDDRTATIDAVHSGRGGARVVGADAVAGVRFSARLLALRDGRAASARLRVAGGALEIEYPGWWRAAGETPAHPSRIRLRSRAQRLKLDLRVHEWAAGGPPSMALLPPVPPGCRPLTLEDLQAGRASWTLTGGRR